MSTSALVWFRRDLRCDDHTALHHALTHFDRVYCAFIFDRDILDHLPSPADRRVEFIWHSVTELKQRLKDMGGDLLVFHANAAQAIPAIADALKVDAVITHHDYEPAALIRDTSVEKTLKSSGIAFTTFKDTCIFEKEEVLTQAGGRFSVFTPYKNAWLKKLTPTDLEERPVVQHAAAFAQADSSQYKALASGMDKLGGNVISDGGNIPSLQDMGFEPTNLLELKIHTGQSGAQATLDEFLSRMDGYKKQRDFPAVKGVSYLSVHMRFGTLSIRQAARHAWSLFNSTGSEGAMGWLNELIWRDFYFQILYNNPRVVDKAFKAEYDDIVWDTDEKAKTLYQRWCDGQTGYPLVDAAMRQLKHTGWMHNRLRMVVASFLTKDLGLDWRWGEKWFADNLNDFDLSANNGGWQWASSSGCDAQPYFRIFNPVSQSEKFDADGKFIHRYCPELAKLPKKFIHAPWEAPAMELQMAGVQLGTNYPRPCVDHAIAREKTLARYAVVKKKVTSDE